MDKTTVVIILSTIKNTNLPKFIHQVSQGELSVWLKSPLVLSQKA